MRPQELEPYLFSHTGEDAIQHLFEAAPAVEVSAKRAKNWSINEWFDPWLVGNEWFTVNKTADELWFHDDLRMTNVIYHEVMGNGSYHRPHQPLTIGGLSDIHT